jgi:hypothetical protein
MSNEDRTVHVRHAPANRAFAALSLALASGAAMGDVELDLSNPA